MNILYYLSPEIELDDPLFRFATYRSIILPECKGLLEIDPTLSAGIVLSRAVYEKAKELGIIDERIHYFVPDHTIATASDNDWYRNAVADDAANLQITRLASLVSSFQPDIIISYEKPSKFIRDCFPRTIVLDNMFGAFSRAPYPALASFDPVGLFGKSFLAVNAKEIRVQPIGPQEKAFLREIRRLAADALAEFQPFKREIAELSEKYDKLVLVPCQVDGYFAFTAPSNYTSHFELVRDVCERVAPDVGVVITQHAYRQALNDEQIQQLRRDYPNFELFPNPHRIPDISQFLVPYVDCVATVSSSIAFQAALWHVPVVAAGQSHINIIASGFNLDDLNRILELGLTNAEEIDNALFFILAKYNRLYRTDVFKGEAHIEFLKELASSLQIDPTGRTFFFGRSIDLVTLTESYRNAFTKYKLREWFEKAKLKPTPDYLLLEISRHKVVFFDLFDTLIQRPFIEPHELFGLIENQVRSILKNKNFPFHRLRRDAEADVRRASKGEYEITLDDIYRRLEELSHLTKEETEKIKDAEIEAELSLCSPKKIMHRYFDIARLTCLKTGIVSDFYIETSFVSLLLERNKLKPDFLFVSASEKVRKHNGSIFPRIKNTVVQTGCKVADILHVGDNKVADKDMPELYGIRAYHLPRAVENLKRSKLGELFDSAFRAPSLSTSLLIGLIANRYYAVPWNQIDTNSIFRGDPHLLGYLGYGPLVLGFAQWIHRECAIHGYTHIYFLARDGYILKKVYEQLYGTSETCVYMYSSRRAASVASLRSIEDIIELAYQSFNSQTFSDFLKNRFGLILEPHHDPLLKEVGLRADTIISPATDMKRVCAFLRSAGDEILALASVERDAYLEYLRSIGYIDALERGKPVLVDIGYSGSMQYYLMKIVPNSRVAGLYMLTHHHAKENFVAIDFRGYLASLDDHRAAYRHKLNDHVFIFESGLSSPEGSLIRFRKSCNRVETELIEAEREGRRVEVLRKIHAGIKQFAFDYSKQLGIFGDCISMPPPIAERILINFAERPTSLDASIFYACEVENVFGGGSVTLIEPSDGFARNPDLRKRQIDRLVALSKWKAGARAYYSCSSSSATVSARVPPPPSNGVLKESTLESDRRIRKLAKLKNNPYRFFADSRFELLRPLRHIFAEHSIGRLARKLVRIAVLSRMIR